MKNEDLLKICIDSVRIEKRLNQHRSPSKAKVLTVEELERIAKAQGVSRRIDYYKRGSLK